MSKTKTPEITRASKITMPAWAISKYGGPKRMMNLPIPLIGPEDVLIRIHGAEVGNWDQVIRTGEWPMHRPFPLVLGLGGAGTVAAAGSHVKGFEKLDRVYAYSYPLYDNGAWAKYMLVHERYAAMAPSTMDLTAAGTFPIAGLTAYETITDVLKVSRDDVVLITAGAGGVGHLAVQLAAHAGAHVITTASHKNREFLERLGAELVIDYNKEDLVAAVRSHYKDGVDKALNGVAGETADQVAETLRQGGHMIDLTASVTSRRRGVHIEADYGVQASGERLAKLSKMIDNNALKVEIQKIYSFAHAADALKTVLGKHVRGKIGIKMA